MATYLPNVKDYVPQMKAYTPDFKFLSDSLDSRQDRYNKTTKQLNNLYGDVVYADLSRSDNQEVRDNYAKRLAPKIQQISGLDFSLAQNVQAAKGLFKPFYEDEHIVRDIVYTKTYKDQMALANSYKKSPVDKERQRYWEDGVQYMNYMMDDFQNKSRSESMSVPLPEYYENPNLYEKAMEVLNTGGPDGKGFKSIETYVDQTGQFIVTQENGVALLSKPTGRTIANPNFDPNQKESASNPKMIEETYNPAANLINQSITDDPTVVQGYQIMAYNDARKFYEEEAKKSGIPVDQLKRQWVKTQIAQFEKETQQTLDKENTELNKTNQELASWDAYVKEAPLIKDSEEYQKWFIAMTKGQTIQQGIDKLEQKRKNILNNPDVEDLDAYMNSGYAAFISNRLGKDIFAAARDYADLTSQHSFEESKIYVEKLRARNNENLARLKRSWKLNDEIQKAIAEQDAATVFPTPIGGDARENIVDYGSRTEANANGELKAHKDINRRMIQTITAFYMAMGDDLNTETNLNNMANYTVTPTNKTTGEVKTSGIFIPNLNSNKLQFYRWEDAGQVLLDNPDLLEYHYNRVVQITQDPDMAASYKKSANEGLRNTISGMISDVDLRTSKLGQVKDMQARVYKNVIETLDLSRIPVGLLDLNLQDLKIDFFDENGYFKTDTEIFDGVYTGIAKEYLKGTNANIDNASVANLANQLKQVLPLELPSTKELTDQFYDKKNRNWITKEQDPRSPATTDMLVQFSNGNATNVQGIMQGYYAGLLQPVADVLGIRNAGGLLSQFYGEPDNENESIKLAPEFQKVINLMKAEMSKVMDSETAIPFETTFDFNSFYYGNPTEGDIAIAPVIPFRYDAGTKDRIVNKELDKFFGAIDNMPDNQVFMTEGDAGAAFSMEYSENDRRTAELVLEAIRADRNYKPGGGAESSGTPGYRIEYSSVGGGEEAGGKYAMYKFILDPDYAKKIASNIDVNFGDGSTKIKDQTITVFLNKDLFTNVDFDPEAQYRSYVKTLILDPTNQGTASLLVPNGGQVNFEMNQGIVYAKTARYRYDVNTGNMVLDDFITTPMIDNTTGAPYSDQGIDKVYNQLQEQLQQFATENLQAQKNHKLTQGSADESENEE